MNTVEFLKQQVALFKAFGTERLEELVRGSRVVSFEAKEAVAHQGDEATHFGVVLSGTVSASVINCGSSSLKYSFYDTTDEANAAHVQTGARGYIEGIQSAG